MATMVPDRIVSPAALETPPAPHTNVSRRVRPARTRRPACCSRHLVTCRRPRRCEAYDDRPLTKESPTWRRSCESSVAAIGTVLPGNAFYAATKAEVVILTRRFAMELVCVPKTSSVLIA